MKDLHLNESETVVSLFSPLAVSIRQGGDVVHLNWVEVGLVREWLEKALAEHMSRQPPETDGPST